MHGIDKGKVCREVEVKGYSGTLCFLLIFSVTLKLLKKKWSVLNKQPCHILLSYIFTEFKTHMIQYQFFHGGGGVG